MDSPRLSITGALLDPPEASSLSFLLRRGIDCAREGSELEGVALIALAREWLTPDQIHFAAVFDAFLEIHASYLQAQRSLHLASKRFAEADIERQTGLLDLEKLLLTLHEEANSALQTCDATQPPKSSQTLPPKQLHQPPQQSSADHHPSNTSNSEPSPPRQILLKEGEVLPALTITCLGHFEVKRGDQPIVLCYRRNGQAILRYLVAQVGYRASIDKLMDVFWPQDQPEVARRKLQIAVSALRCSLNNGYVCGSGEGYILCKDGFYQFNPSVTIKTDADEFLALWQAGGRAAGSEMATLYESACNLYIGPFLVEDTYADWSSVRREHLKQIYVTMCRTLATYHKESRRYEDAVKWISALLREDPCDEAAHRQLVRTYIAQGRRSEALQQYYRCERILFKELGLPPMPETTSLLQAILNSAD